VCGIFFFFTGSTVPWALTPDFQFHDHFTDGRIRWMGDQLAASPLPKHWATRTQNKRAHIPHIQALCGIRTHDPGFRANEDHSATVTRVYRNNKLKMRSRSNKRTAQPYINKYINYIRMIKSRRIGWAGHVARMV
jgi:hypothetical protein